jgi:hypothetical protein
MRWFLSLPPRATGAYIAYGAICLLYTIFAIGASIASVPHRQRIRRGSWAHVAEGWAFVAVVWTALLLAHFYLAAHTWPHIAGTPGNPSLLRLAAIALWVLRPVALLAPIIMVVTTVVHLLPRPAASAPTNEPSPI